MFTEFVFQILLICFLTVCFVRSEFFICSLDRVHVTARITEIAFSIRFQRVGRRVRYFEYDAQLLTVVFEFVYLYSNSSTKFWSGAFCKHIKYSAKSLWTSVFRISIILVNSCQTSWWLLTCVIAVNPCVSHASCSVIIKQSCSHTLQPQQISRRMFWISRATAFAYIISNKRSVLFECSIVGVNVQLIMFA